MRRLSVPSLVVPLSWFVIAGVSVAQSNWPQFRGPEGQGVAAGNGNPPLEFAPDKNMKWKVEVPHALPTVMAGVTQCIMLSLSMVVIAALVGATGLGTPVVRALNTVNIPMGFESGIVIVLLAIVLDRVCRAPARKGSH